MDCINSTQEIIIKYKNQSFLIAYSGGLDSTVLLYNMIQIKKNIPHIKIRAIHINHNFNKLSKKWIIHCKKTCIKHHVPLILAEINIDKKIKKHTNNIEEKLRIQRYNIIYKHLLPNEILLTGHHMNDQCETLILSLKRGSGPTGLSGMSDETKFGYNKKIIRPFLNITKKELKNWAYRNHLKWVEDTNNLNTDHDRNFIRHEIIPILEKRWPFFIKTCFRTSKICQQENIVKKILLHEKIQYFTEMHNSLRIHQFQNMNKNMCTELIRYWLFLNNIKTISYQNIQVIYNQMICSRIDANPKIKLKQHEIRRYKKSIYLIKNRKNLKNTILFWHNQNIQLTLPNNLGCLTKNNYGMILPKPQKNEIINIRFQLEGKILIFGKSNRQKVKKVWQENHIPPWERNQVPLLFYDNCFISALGIFVIQTNKKYKSIWHISWSDNLNSTYTKKFVFS
ncbi:MAG: tRNA lysidine(34) synthetase TilS [Buchnera aphidicola (Pentalonia nigronervosa)]|jgi:tRNA(Ile)-lysidine synthase|uniref:tRNA(Ile)-lysidine synthase n=1 Tax=Buchnera aphidicola (Pentalonia nigronervosa) TaxID=1309793 RepID=A0A7H1AZE5_9GAMM|nr:MAG: tRNA lysidine(34) synthetase TilS [Buchnera aphidicola (Pentalonia nigronervosa)]